MYLASGTFDERHGGGFTASRAWKAVLLGENDRFHCPAGLVWRSEFLPFAAWGEEPEAWRRGFDELGITNVVWRSDRAPESVLARLADRLEPVARNGPATLYRVRRSAAAP